MRGIKQDIDPDPVDGRDLAGVDDFERAGTGPPADDRGHVETAAANVSGRKNAENGDVLATNTDLFFRLSQGSRHRIRVVGFHRSAGEGELPRVVTQIGILLDQHQVEAAHTLTQQDQNRRRTPAPHALRSGQPGEGRRIGQQWLNGEDLCRYRAGSRARRRHARGSRINFSATAGSVGPSPKAGQSAATGQAPQAGFLAWQQRRPCQMTR